MSADDPHFRLRVPAELRDRIRDAAEANKRSMNAEIVARLEQTFAWMAMADAGFISRQDMPPEVRAYNDIRQAEAILRSARKELYAKNADLLMEASERKREGQEHE
ncbi:MAG: Arc family DNA-binding protein [Hyphomicrobiales bacterium]|nr:MAG: Arc family DNA-binding protein [Hyphomicrobiales bacterium]